MGHESDIVRSVDPGHVVLTLANINAPLGKQTAYTSSKP
jgi:hypothetical protein